MGNITVGKFLLRGNLIMKKIVFLTADWNPEIAEKVYTAVYEAADKLDFTIDIFSCFGGLVEEGNVIGEYDIYKLPDFKKYDGALVMASQIHAETARDRVVALTRNANIPVVSINVPLENTIQVGTDNYHSFCQMVEHVITTHNAQNIVMVEGPRGYEADIRKQAFTDTISRYNLHDSVTYIKGDWSLKSGGNAAARILQNRDHLPDAVVCANDDMAIGCAERLEMAGVHVPDDLIVTGFDDNESSRIFSPSITTVSRDYNKMILDAMENVLAEIEQKPHQTVLFSDHKLVLRESCGCKEHSDAGVKMFRRKYTSMSRQLSEVEFELDKMTGEFFGSDSVYEMFEHVEKYASIFGVNDLYVFVYHQYFSSMLDGKPMLEPQAFHLVDLIACQENRPFVDEKEHIYKTFEMAELIPQDIHESSRVWLFYPIHFMQEPVGYVALKNFNPAVARRQIRRPLNSFAMAMDNLRKKVRLEKMNKALGEKADRDPLTGLFNRYGFNSHALPVKNFVLENGSVLEFLFIDVDEMKQINDNFGHGAGDQCLVTLSKTIMDISYREHYRDNNFIAMRFGGDEFIIICEKKKTSFAKLLKSEVGKMNMLRQYPFDIKISIGVLDISPDDTFTADEMLKIADDRMYEEKRKKKSETDNETPI